MGQSPPGSTYNNQNDGLPFFQGKAQFGERFPTPDKWCSKPIRVAQKGDVLVSVRAPVGPTNLAADRCCIGRGLAAIRSVTPSLDQTYLHWFMRHAEPVLVAKSSGSTFEAIGRREIAALVIPLPPLHKQRRIGALLDRSAEIKRRAEAARAKAREIVPALFLDTFGDPAANPKGWPVRPLTEVAEIGSGVTKGRRLSGPASGSAPYLRVANVQDGYLDLTEVKEIEAIPSDFAKYALLPGDLLMTEGGDPDKLGRCAIWRGEIEGCLHQNHIFRVRLQPRLLPDYAAAFIQGCFGKSYFLRVAKRTTGIASINKTQLGALPVVIPPSELQMAYAVRVERIEDLRRNLDAAAKDAEATAAALSAEIFG
jgi:type I restriction enzyme S subunit